VTDLFPVLKLDQFNLLFQRKRKAIENGCSYLRRHHPGHPLASSGCLSQVWLQRTRCSIYISVYNIVFTYAVLFFLCNFDLFDVFVMFNFIWGDSDSDCDSSGAVLDLLVAHHFRVSAWDYLCYLYHHQVKSNFCKHPHNQSLDLLISPRHPLESGLPFSFLYLKTIFLYFFCLLI